MRRNASDVDSETYKLKIVTLDHGQPEKFLQLIMNLKRAVDRTGAKTSAGKINYLRTLLSGEALQEFDKLAIQNTGMNNVHLKLIQEGLLILFSD